jgi:hypothetical protein
MNVALHSPTEAEAAFHQLATTARLDGVHGYWLLDQSSLPQGAWLKRLVGHGLWVDVLSGKSETAFNGASPVLVSASGACATPQFVKSLYRTARFANSVSLIDSELTLGELQVVLCENARIELPEAFEAVLRYFDTRTLPLLPRLLHPLQYAAFMRASSRWAYLDRWGEPRFMPAAQPLSQEQASQPGRLVLDEAQETQLIDDGLTDAVIDMLLTQHHPALSELTPPEQFDVVGPLVKNAEAAGLTEPPQAFAFVATALEHGASFDQREPWSSRLKQYRAQQCSLEAVFA